MDEHKNFRKPKRPSASLDGMVSGRQLGVPTHRSYRPGQGPTARLSDSYHRPDGFHTTTKGPHSVGQSPEAAEAAALLLDEPIVLDDADDEPAKKKHYFGHKPSRLKKFAKRGALIIAALLVLGVGYFGLKIYNTERHLFRGGGEAPALAAEVDINQLEGEGDGRVNILLLGHDGPGYDGADLTDTILLASIDPVNHKAVLLSIPRDLCVASPCSSNQKINAVYALAKQNSSAKTLAGQEADGLAKLNQTIHSVLGININYHVVLDFQAFQDVVNNLGGVTLNVTPNELNWPSYNPDELYDPTIAWENHGNPVIAKEGTQTMNGAQALLFARSRETSSDFARNQRQRALIVAIKNKAFTAGTFSNPIKVSDLLNSLGNNVYTDLSLNDTGRLYQILSQIPSSQITSLDLVTPPNQLITTGTGAGNTSIDRPVAGLFNYTDIQTFVRQSLPDGFILKENAKVAVYNATSRPGVGTSEAALLKTYSYNITTVGNAMISNPATTTIIDLSKGKDAYTRHYLEQRFSVTARTSLPASYDITPPAGTAFVIILGEDVANSTQ